MRGILALCGVVAGVGVLAGAAIGQDGAPARKLTERDLKGAPWRSIGPAIMGGRTVDLAIAPGNSKEIYAALATSGLWKTSNRGNTWSPVFDKEKTLSIGSVVVCDAPADWPGWAAEEEKERAAGKEPGTPAPAKPGETPKSPDELKKEKGKARIVWVGTGEGNGRNSSSFGRGVYRSTDAGGTWTALGLEDSHDIPALAVDPRNVDVCYVAALGHLWSANEMRGVFKTSDGGKTWEHVLKIDADTGCVDVILDHQNPDTVYAAMYQRRRTGWSYQSGGKEGGIYRSDDAGKTWKKLGGGLPNQTGRIGLDVYRKDPRIVYAVVESDEGGNNLGIMDERSRRGGVFRSEDKGETWARVSNLTPRAFYFSKIRVDPTNDQRVYLLGFTLYVSDDGGKNFRSGGAKKPHGDMHALLIDPEDPAHLIMGTDGGIYQSFDKSATWDFLNTMALGQFYNVTLEERGEVGDFYRLGGGLQDNGTWLGASGYDLVAFSPEPDKPGAALMNDNWRMVCWGDGYHFGFDPNDADIVYAEWQGGNIIRNNTRTHERKIIKPEAKESQIRHRFNWNSPFFVSRHGKKEDGTTLYMGGNFVFKLTHGGDFFEKISPDLSHNDVTKVQTIGSDAETFGTVVTLAESPTTAGLLWAGTDDGRVHVTTDDGKNWKEVTAKEIGGRYVSRVEPSRFDVNVAYITIDGHRSGEYEPHVMMSADQGASWKDITADVPKEAGWAHVVREDVANPNVLYLGTERGLFVSVDRGGSWVNARGDALPPVGVHDIKIHPRTRDVVAATHGRSLWILDDAWGISGLTPEVMAKRLHLFPVQPCRARQFGWRIGEDWSDRPFGAPNPPFGAVINYWVREYDGEGVDIVITDTSGTKVRKLSGPNGPGLNRVVWDLRRDGPERIETPDSELDQKTFVPPGEYTVTLTCDKKSSTAKVVVHPAGPSAK